MYKCTMLLVIIIIICSNPELTHVSVLHDTGDSAKYLTRVKRVRYNNKV